LVSDGTYQAEGCTMGISARWLGGRGMALNRTAACVIVAGAAALAAPSAMAGPGSFPDDWFFYGTQRPQELRSLEGKKVTEISAAEWKGEETKVSDQQGKVVIIDFFATWCGPCMAAVPENVEMVKKYKDKGLVFVGLHDSNSGWDKIDQVISEKSINYPVALDKKENDKGITVKAYNLRFWPTYVAVDKSGVIRAAGLKPQHVEDVVKALLAEDYNGPMPGKADAGASDFPDDWYYGGNQRPKWLRMAEGKPMQPMKTVEWLGDPVTPKAMEKKVAVLQFVQPELGLSMEKLEKLNPLVEKYSRQGVVFIGVCDASSNWERMTKAASARKIAMPIALDAPPEGDDGGRGVTSHAFGVRYGPVTAVVDRAGVVRAVGLKEDHLEEVINKLLSEPLPAAPAQAESPSGS
jgi:thiol-disulfide isomerase/thioredoxin